MKTSLTYRILSMILCVVMLLSAVSVGALASSDELGYDAEDYAEPQVGGAEEVDGGIQVVDNDATVETPEPTQTPIVTAEPTPTPAPTSTPEPKQVPESAEQSQEEIIDEFNVNSLEAEYKVLDDKGKETGEVIRAIVSSDSPVFLNTWHIAFAPIVNLQSEQQIINEKLFDDDSNKETTAIVGFDVRLLDSESKYVVLKDDISIQIDGFDYSLVEGAELFCIYNPEPDETRPNNDGPQIENIEFSFNYNNGATDIIDSVTFNTHNLGSLVFGNVMDIIAEPEITEPEEVVVDEGNEPISEEVQEPSDEGEPTQEEDINDTEEANKNDVNEESSSSYEFLEDSKEESGEPADENDDSGSGGNELPDESDTEDVEKTITDEGAVEDAEEEEETFDEVFEEDPIIEDITEEDIEKYPVIYNKLEITPESVYEPLLAAANPLLTLSMASVPAQDPITMDGQTIEKITMRWLSKSTGSSEKAGFDRLVLVPTTDGVPNQQFQLDFSLSGKGDHEIGSVEVIIPAYIWKDRDGNEVGELTLGIPQDPDNSADFAWKRVGDYIVITNTHKLSAASKVMIQGTFRNMKSHEMLDIDTVDTEKEYRGISDELFAVITLVTSEEHAISMTSNSIDASIDTRVQVASANKSARNNSTGDYFVYYTVPNNIPTEFLPDNPDDYLYIRWYVSGTAEGNQPYTMTLSDTAEDAYGCIMLGIEGSTNVKSTDGKTVSMDLFTGYRALNENTTTQVANSAFVWTAYPFSELDEDEINELHNTATVAVTGVDDNIVTSMDASDVVRTRIPRIYTFEKIWDDNDNERGVRPTSLGLRIYRDGKYWKYVNVREGLDGKWLYSWSDEGQEHYYDVQEVLNARGTYDSYYDANGMRHYLQWNYYLEHTDYNDSERKWTYINAYSEGWIKAETSYFDKILLSTQYNDTSLKSSRDRALNDLLRGEEVVIAYRPYGRAAIAEWTLDQESNAVVAITDDIYTFDWHNVTTDDIDIAYVGMQIPTVYDYTDYDDSTGYYAWKYADEAPDIRLYGYINDAWVHFATMSGNSVTVVEGTGATANGMTVSLPKGVSKVKEEMESGNAIVYMSYNIGLRIYPSDTIVGYIEEALEKDDYIIFRVYNEANMTVDFDGQRVLTMKDGATAYLHGRQYRVATGQTKSFEFIENDVSKRRLRLRTNIVVTEQSNILSIADYRTAIADETIPYVSSGTWYDLLPPGVEPDLSTVKLGSGDNVKAAYTVENYQGSGRTMLVVVADFADHIAYTNKSSSNPYYSDTTYPKEGYKNSQTLTFDSFYSWDEAKDRGLEGIRNVVAFETDDDWIGNIVGWSGETDDPTSGNHKMSLTAVGTDVDLMTNLDKTRDDASFVYAGAYLVATEIDMSALTSLRKHVQADGTGIWSYGHNGEVVVYESGKYTYRLSVMSESDTQTKNIIIVDSIENYVPTDDKVDYGDTQWRGKLRSLDISQIRESGVDAVVYYSIVPGLDISAYNTSNVQGAVIDKLQNDTIGGEHVWSTTPPEDLSTVTAIAVDARYTTDGEPFVLDEGEQLIMYYHMQAPCGDTSIFDDDDPYDHNNNSHAYNNVYLDATQIDELGQETHAYIHFDYTKVGILPYEITVTKQWKDSNNNDGIRPDSVTVHLIANGTDTGKTVVLSADNEEAWTGVFEHIQLYDDDGEYIMYSFEEDPVDGYTTSIINDDNNITVINAHTPERISVPVTKTWEDDELSDGEFARPASITVRLYADGKYTGKSITIRPNVDGEWSGAFNNLLKYSSGRVIEYTVQEVPVSDFIVSYDGNDITNTYYPFGDLQIQKVITNATEASSTQLFTFTILLQDAEGNDLLEKYNYETSTGATGKIGNGDSIQLRGGESVLIEDVPSKSRYNIIEDGERGWSVVGSANQNGTITSGTVSDVQFTNKYSSKVNVNIELNKELQGRNIDRYQFKFNLYDDEGTLVRAATNNATGSVQFGAIRYTEADDGHEFIYTISEEDRGKPGYTYDTAMYTIKVVPHDLGNGTMSCDITYFDEQGEEVQSPTFTNQYHAEGEIVIRAWKDLVGREIHDGEFFFELTNEDGDVIGTATNAADGSIVFDPIQFTEVDVGKTYNYHVREVTGEDPTVNYSDATFGYVVTIADNGDGTLAIAMNTQKLIEMSGGTWAEIFVNAPALLTIIGYGGIEARDAAIAVQRGYKGSWIPASGANTNPETFLNNVKAKDPANYQIVEREVGETEESFVARLIALGASDPPDSGSFQYNTLYFGGTNDYQSAFLFIHSDTRYVVEGENEVPVFYNTLKDGALSISKTVVDADAANPNQEFRFIVRLIGDDVADGEYDYELEQIPHDE